MQEVTQVIGVKRNFCKNLHLGLLQTFHYYLPVTQYNAVNHLLGTKATNLSLSE